MEGEPDEPGDETDEGVDEEEGELGHEVFEQLVVGKIEEEGD